ncbi:MULTISPECIES: hypothetical protein [Pantoea]|uniref:phage tail fiber protein n=1 Tax=Pantoea TaxID=53335 RepID=UPI00257F56AC|nr:hypothetical protein [Pantoea sp. UBA5960]
MPAGTITLTNGSATVTGSGTNFTSELKAGDFIYVMVGGAPYTLVVSAIGSNTQVTLAIAYDGPTSSGLAWVAAPALMQAAITQKILNDFATVARGRILDFQNWQKIYSDAQSVTVTRPDRTTFTGPSWGYMAAQYASKANSGANKDITSLTGLTTAISVEQGGTGQNSAGLAWKALLDGRSTVTARADLGLGSAATKDAGLSSGDVFVNQQNYRLANSDIVPNASGTSTGVNMAGLTYDGHFKYILSQSLGDSGIPSSTDNGTGFCYAQCYSLNGGNRTYLFVPYATNGNSGDLCWRGVFNSSTTPMITARSTRNTTVDANGFIKAASPILRLTNNSGAMDESFGDGFLTYDYCAVNSEAEGVTARKIGKGKYKITGANGLAKEGWTIEIPQDINKNLLCFVDAEEVDSGDIVISVYKRKFDVESSMVVSGDAMDIPDGRWIDVRLSMS